MFNYVLVKLSFFIQMSFITYDKDIHTRNDTLYDAENNIITLRIRPTTSPEVTWLLHAQTENDQNKIAFGRQPLIKQSPSIFTSYITPVAKYSTRIQESPPPRRMFYCV